MNFFPYFVQGIWVLMIVEAAAKAGLLRALHCCLIAVMTFCSSDLLDDQVSESYVELNNDCIRSKNFRTLIYMLVT